MTDPNYKPPPGRLGNLSEEQKEALERLKKELKDEGAFVEERMDDATLLRFLRARKFDVALAKKMLLDAEQWRKDFGVEDIVKNFDFKERDEVAKYYPQYYHKTDKAGRPIYIERFNNLDVSALQECTSFDRVLRRLVFEYEKSLQVRLPGASEAAGHPIETFCTILDLGGCSISSFWRVKDYVMAASKIGQDRYPETMGKFFLLSVPWGFTTIWSLVKPWLDEVTVAKIDILSGSNMGKLLESIDADCLQQEFGGTCQCPGGCEKSDAGPWKK